MLFSILVGILSVFAFVCGFMELSQNDAPPGLKLTVAGGCFAISLALALACRFV